MSIAKQVRDSLLVEARHRCTICMATCFEIHHIVESAEGGTDDEENLIVLCPNCHQHRYHRSGEFTRDQLRRYKLGLRDSNEIERRLLRTLEEIRAGLGTASATDIITRTGAELREAAQLVNRAKAPNLHASITETSRWLAEHDVLRQGARRAIEIKWDAELQRINDDRMNVVLTGVDHDGWKKADEFPAAYTLVFNLNVVPPPDWSACLVHEWRHSFYNMKRTTYVRRAQLVMIVADSDNMQWHADFAKRIVSGANNLYDSQVLGLRRTDVNKQKSQELQQFDTVQTLKRITLDIKL